MDAPPIPVLPATGMLNGRRFWTGVLRSAPIILRRDITRGWSSFPTDAIAIRNSVTAAKDQTYALYNLTQEQLSRTLMPVGDYTKEEIREIAERIGLPVAQKKDSHGNLLYSGS